MNSSTWNRTIYGLAAAAAIAGAVSGYLCRAEEPAASFETEVQGVPGNPPDYRALAVRLLEERCEWYKQRFESLKGEYDSGTRPITEVWQAQLEWDLARLELLRYRDPGFSDPGLPEAFLRLKAAEAITPQIKQQWEAAGIPQDQFLNQQLTLNRARLSYLEAWQSCADPDAFREAVKALAGYPNDVATDAQLTALIAAETSALEEQ